MQGQTLIVLGGSRGIGLATAQRASNLGADVLIAARSVEALERAAEAHPRLRFAPCDITDAASVQRCFDAIDHLDHLFVAAGAFVQGSLREAGPSGLRRALEARVLGAAAAAHAALPKLRPGGSILFTGGVSTDRPAPGAFGVSVSTAAAEQLARVLAVELAPIRVNAIAPGWTDTPMWDAVLGDSKAATFAAIAAKIPVRRLATDEEVAEAALFLMQNRSVTGETLHVDGGLRLV